MAISVDVVASTIEDLLPKYSETFTKWHPLLDAVVTGGQVTRKSLQGPHREFTIVTGGPGQITEIPTGNEVINGGRKQLAVRANEYANRMIYAYDVPRKDLAEANGKMDLARVIAEYPQNALAEFHEFLATQLAVGGGANNTGGFVTLNGDPASTYNPGGIGSRAGILEFNAPAAQTNVVHGRGGPLGTPATVGWYNQYGDAGSFIPEGVRTMRDVYFRAQREGKVTLGAPKLMFADSASFLNYMDTLDGFVQTTTVGMPEGTSNYGRQAIAFIDGKMFLEDAIDLTASSFTSRNGVIYFINPDTFELFVLGHNAAMEGKGFFDQSKPLRIPDLDAFRFELVLYAGLYCKQRRANGLVTGTSI